MTIDERDGIAALLAIGDPPGSAELGDACEGAVAALRTFLDAFAGARTDVTEAHALREALEALTPFLRERETDERQRLWGHWLDRPGRGQALVPRVYDEVRDELVMTAKVVFGRFHVGENMAVHGGAISLLFDDILGWLGHHAQLAPSRTAYLKTNFRSVTPVGVELQIRARIDRIEGRKRFLRGELFRGDTLCADVEGLWIELRSGQQ